MLCLHCVRLNCVISNHPLPWEEGCSQAKVCISWLGISPGSCVLKATVKQVHQMYLVCRTEELELKMGLSWKYDGAEDGASLLFHGKVGQNFTVMLNNISRVSNTFNKEVSPSRWT